MLLKNLSKTKAIEIAEWLAKNNIKVRISCPYKIGYSPQWSIAKFEKFLSKKAMSPSHSDFEFRFRNKDTATLFKLTWM